MYNQTKKQLKRLFIGTVGGLLLIVGILAIPYPGPGWVIVFSALAILSTEFDWAKRILHYAKGKYDKWQLWVKEQNIWVRGIFIVLTFFVVIMTIWLLNGYGYMSDIFNLGWDWIRSPIPWFY